MKLEDLRYGRKVLFQGTEYKVACNGPYDPKLIPLRNDDADDIWSSPYARIEELEMVQIDDQDPLVLEDEFKQVFEQINPLIQANLKEAARLINEAVAMSEKSGVPFRPKEKIIWMAPSYIPNSFRDKFPLVEEEFVNDLTDSYGWDKGWQYSQTC